MATVKAGAGKPEGREGRNASDAPGRGRPTIPLLDLSRQYAPLREEILAAVERVCGSQHFILGEEVAQFERELAKFLNQAETQSPVEVVGCSSGTDGLWLALVAAGVKPGDSVLTTPFSFFATASAIVRTGARPVFADIDGRTLNLSAEEARRRARSATKLGAILPVHLYGQCADMDGLGELAEELEVTVVEDAAQAIGATWRGRRAGTLGAAAAFSFYPTKNLSAMGDAGGATGRAQAAERMRSLRNHGSARRYFHEEMGWNARLDAIQAAVLRVKLRHLEKWNEERRKRAVKYDSLLAAAGLTAGRSQSQHGQARRETRMPVRLPATLPQADHVFHQYVIRAERRDELRKFLAERGIGTEVYYPLPLHLQKCFAYLGYREGELPEAERAAREVLALPIFPEITEEEQERVVGGVAEFYR